MATKLGIYNGALRVVGERKLASLTENREPRRILDDEYDGAVRYCLEQGYWKFAQRMAKLEFTGDITPEFGYRRAFEKPTDFIRTAKMCYDEYFTSPLLEYNEEKGYWFADVDELYVVYISNDAEYGMDLTAWPEVFTHYVELHLATEIAQRLTQSADAVASIEKKTYKAMLDARNKSAVEGPTEFLPTGSWASARRGRSAFTRKNRGSLLG